MKNQTFQVPSWYDKNASQSTRRKNALKAHKGDLLATYRALKYIASRASPEVSKKATQDAKYFHEKHKSSFTLF